MALTAPGNAGSWRSAPIVGAILGAGAIIAAALLYAILPRGGPAAHPWKPSFRLSARIGQDRTHDLQQRTIVRAR